MRSVSLILVFGAFVINSSQGNILDVLASNENGLREVLSERSEDSEGNTQTTPPSTEDPNCFEEGCSPGRHCITGSNSICKDSTESCSCVEGCVYEDTFYTEGDSFTTFITCMCFGGAYSGQAMVTNTPPPPTTTEPPPPSCALIGCPQNDHLCVRTDPQCPDSSMPCLCHDTDLDCTCIKGCLIVSDIVLPPNTYRYDYNCTVYECDSKSKSGGHALTYTSPPPMTTEPPLPSCPLIDCEPNFTCVSTMKCRDPNVAQCYCYDADSSCACKTGCLFELNEMFLDPSTEVKINCTIFFCDGNSQLSYNHDWNDEQCYDVEPLGGVVKK